VTSGVTVFKCMFFDAHNINTVKYRGMENQMLSDNKQQILVHSSLITVNSRASDVLQNAEQMVVVMSSVVILSKVGCFASVNDSNSCRGLCQFVEQWCQELAILHSCDYRQLV